MYLNNVLNRSKEKGGWGGGVTTLTQQTQRKSHTVPWSVIMYGRALSYSGRSMTHQNKGMLHAPLRSSSPNSLAML